MNFFFFFFFSCFCLVNYLLVVVVVVVVVGGFSFQFFNSFPHSEFKILIVFHSRDTAIVQYEIAWTEESNEVKIK